MHVVLQQIRCLARFAHCPSTPPLSCQRNLSDPPRPSSTHDDRATTKLGLRCWFCVTRRSLRCAPSRVLVAQEWTRFTGDEHLSSLQYTNANACVRMAQSH